MLAALTAKLVSQLATKLIALRLAQMFAKPAVHAVAQASGCLTARLAAQFETKGLSSSQTSVRKKIATLAAGREAVAPARVAQTAVSPALQAALQAAVLLAVPAALLHFNKTRKMYARFVGSSSPQEERLITIRVERHEMLAIEKLRTKQLKTQIGSGLLDTPGFPAKG